MFCPHCKEEITSLNYTASYSERCYGNCNGSYDIDNEDHNQDDSEQTNSDDWEEDDYEYECPECDHSVDIDELLEDLEDNEEQLKKDTEAIRLRKLSKFFKIK